MLLKNRILLAEYISLSETKCALMDSDVHSCGRAGRTTWWSYGDFARVGEGFADVLCCWSQRLASCSMAAT